MATETGATVLLLSDGYANAGVIDPVQLRGLAKRAAEHRVTTSTIGIGLATTRQFSRNWQLVETATIHSVMAQTMRPRQSRPSSMVSLSKTVRGQSAD